ncbi:hypothetical protein K440DRAFT_627715 [Wilcoxina mikolae CBS 423.85]|nr:hypothetical protein K440DRAFT_627715 [Wilcoxina mikolae CBS 423.85]
MGSPWPGGGGDSYHFTENVHFRYHLLLVALLLLLLVPSSATEVGYGPEFDACGDNCQTALRIFCTEGRNAEQQAQCWCGAGDLGMIYRDRMENCLATCDPAVSRIETQREVMIRFKEVVCRGNTRGDEWFQEYYRTRYPDGFQPDATQAAPPPVVVLETAATRNSSATATKTRARPTHSRHRTSSITPTLSSSIVSSTATSTTFSTQTLSSATSSSSIPTASATPDPPLSAGAIAGISAASVVTFAGLILLIAFLLRRRRQQSRLSQETELTSTPVVAPLERRVSVYYSPDDVGVVPSARGAWRNGDAHPGVRVASVTPTEIETSDGEVDGDGDGDGDACSESSSSIGSSGWTDYEEGGFYDIDLGEYGNGYDPGGQGGYDPGVGGSVVASGSGSRGGYGSGGVGRRY